MNIKFRAWTSLTAVSGCRRDANYRMWRRRGLLDFQFFFGVFGFWSVMRNKCIEEREEKESRISNSPVGLQTLRTAGQTDSKSKLGWVRILWRFQIFVHIVFGFMRRSQSSLRVSSMRDSGLSDSSTVATAIHSSRNNDTTTQKVHLILAR